MLDARLPNPETLFNAAREHMESVIGRLASSETLTMSHSEVEVFVQREGRETMRRLLQAHFDIRSHARPAATIIGKDGEARTHRRIRSIPLKTVVGEVAITREAYSSRDAGSLHPLDSELNLPENLYSLPLQRFVALEASKNSFEEAVETVEQATGTVVPKRQGEEVTRLAAVDFDSFYETRRETGANPPAADSGPILVITSDGKGVAMRKEDLRASTKKAASKRKLKLEKRLSKGEKRNQKRMAMVAAVYTIAAFVRRPEDIVRDLEPVHDVVRRPRPEKKRVWASVEKTPEAVLDEAFQEALSRDPKRKKQWVGLVDGNEVQLADFIVLAEHYRVKMTMILDVIHVLEYLWKATWVFHDEGDKAAEKWVSDRLLEILNGRASSVAGGIRRSATKRGLDDKARQPADECANYLLKYKEFMRYDEYLAAGYPIATGVIEGACRHLVQDRMGRTGARWGLDGAEAVLRLRALRSSGDFESYWKFHEDCELTRNHRSLYPHGELPQMVLPELVARRAVRRSNASSS